MPIIKEISDYSSVGKCKRIRREALAFETLNN